MLDLEMDLGLEFDLDLVEVVVGVEDLNLLEWLLLLYPLWSLELFVEVAVGEVGCF